MDIGHMPRCYGAAKNYFTNAVKNDPGMKLPQYPLIFSKPLSVLKPIGDDFKIPWFS